MLDPHYAATLAYKADALGMLGRYEEAVACCDQAIGLNPQDAMAFGTMGALMLKLGREEAALACLEQAQRLGDPRAGQVVAALRRGWSLSE